DEPAHRGSVVGQRDMRRGTDVAIKGTCDALAITLNRARPATWPHEIRLKRCASNVEIQTSDWIRVAWVAGCPAQKAQRSVTTSCSQGIEAPESCLESPGRKGRREIPTDEAVMLIGLSVSLASLHKK